MGYVRTIAFRYLRSKRRLNFITLVSLLASGGVFHGVAELTIVLSVMNGFEDQVQRRIAGTNAHIAVLGSDDAPLPSGEAIPEAIRKALEVWGPGTGAHRARWQKIQRNGMDLPFGWKHRIGRYVELYEKLQRSA